MFAAFTMAGEVANPAAPPVVPAGLNTQQQQQQEQQQQSVSSAGASNGGQSNGQYIIFNSPEKSISEAKVEYSGTQTLKNVPSVGGPPLTASNDTCMGSTSASVNVAGFGGSYGTTWTDENCVMLKNSREMWNMGMRAAGLARLCFDKNNRDSLAMTGYECPQIKLERERGIISTPSTQNNQGIHPEVTDELVRKRMGYPPLK